jgi:hypothetical protein
MRIFGDEASQYWIGKTLSELKDRLPEWYKFVITNLDEAGYDPTKCPTESIGCTYTALSPKVTFFRWHPASLNFGFLYASKIAGIVETLVHEAAHHYFHPRYTGQEHTYDDPVYEMGRIVRRKMLNVLAYWHTMGAIAGVTAALLLIWALNEKRK